MQKVSWLSERETANKHGKEILICYLKFITAFFTEGEKQASFAVTKHLLTASTITVKRLSLEFILFTLAYSNSRIV